MTDTPVTVEMSLRDGSRISWTDYTFNPWIGCERVSPACDHCYAEARDVRFEGGSHWGKDALRRRTSDSNWRKPLSWNRKAERDGVRRRVFCASLADVFEGRDDLDGHRADLWDLIAATPHLDWLLLTKRPQNILAMTPWAWRVGPHSSPPHREDPANWPTNVWVGTTVEDQPRANVRVPHLLRVPARVRFLSCEPLLGPVDLHAPKVLGYRSARGVLHPEWESRIRHENLAEAIQWVLIGGESGAHARRMDPAWAASLIDQCTTAGVAVHMKQAGAVLGAEWGMTDAGHDLDAMPPEFRIREWPDVNHG